MKRSWLMIALGVILIFFVFTNYIPNGFTWLEHGDIEQGLAFKPFPQILFSRYANTGFYRPLVALIHWIDLTLFKSWAPGYHLTNIVLHLCAMIASVFALRTVFGISWQLAIATGMISAIHPLVWLPVGAISYRQELTMACGIYLALYFHIKARTTSKKKYIYGAIFCFILALASKETSLILIPLYLLFWEYTQRKKHLHTLIPVLFGEILVIIFYLVLRLAAVPEIWKSQSLTLDPITALGTRLFVLGNRFIDLVSPFAPKLNDATPLTGLLNIQVVIVLVVLVACAFYLIRNGLQSNYSKVLVFIAISLLPSLNLIPLPRFNSPHYSYIALPFFTCLVLIVLKRWRYTRIAIVMWLCVAIVSTYQAGKQFKNDNTLFSPEVSKGSTFKEGAFYLGMYYWQAHDLNKADTYFKMAIAPQKGFIAYVDKTSAFINYAGVRIQMNDPRGADKLLVQAEQFAQPEDLYLIAYNRALIATRQKEYKKVIELLEPILVRNEIYIRPEPYLLLTQAYNKTGRKKDAINLIKRLKDN